MLFLPNADLDLRTMLEREAHDHPRLKNARIVAGVHRTEQWEAVATGAKARPDGGPAEWTNSQNAQITMRRAVKAGTLAFMTYSPQVDIGLQDLFSRNGFSKRTKSQTFVPVIPNIAKNAPTKETGNPACRKAVIQGSFNGDRDYARIFADLERAIRTDPAAWGYGMESAKDQGETEQLVDLGLSAGAAATGFELHLLGHIKHYNTAYRGSKLLDPVIRVQPNLQYLDVSYESEFASILSLFPLQYYRTIAEMDVLLPAWLHSTPYVQSRSSSSVPAAIMARTPALLSAKEVQAYSYARQPAVLDRRTGESEVVALKRLRATQQCRRSSTRHWLEFEETIKRANQQVLATLFM